MEVNMLDRNDGQLVSWNNWREKWLFHESGSGRRLEVLSDWNPGMQIKRVKKKNEEGEEDEDDEDEEGKEDEEEEED